MTATHTTTRPPLSANLSHVANEVYTFSYTEAIPTHAQRKNTDMFIPCRLQVQQTTFHDFDVVVLTASDNVGDKYTTAAYSLEAWESLRNDAPIIFVSNDDDYIYAALDRGVLWAPARRS